MLTSKSVPTPMLPSEKLLLDGGEKLLPEDITHYRSFDGALQYLSLTRPNISFCVNSLPVHVLPDFCTLGSVQTDSPLST